MEIVTVGLDCKRAPVEVRERISFPHHNLAEAYNALNSKPFVGEAAILSTCNRVEIYVVCEHKSYADVYAELRNFLSEFHGVPETDFAPYLFYLNGKPAVQHLFEVACGLKSMVLGEPQIQGQVREAIDYARKYGAAGRVLDALFRAAISTGKRARTETAISENGISVSFTAVEMLEEKSGSLEGKHALIIGAGKTGRLTAQILVDRKIGAITFINRDMNRAHDTIQQLGFENARVRSFAETTEALAAADLVVGCTSAPHALVRRAHLEEAMVDRATTRPIYMVDIAVPRDIEPDSTQVSGVHVWDIDDIKIQAEANMARRYNEVGRVRAIVQEELADFQAWMGALAVVPTITTLRQHADAIRKAELNRTIQAMGNVSDREARLLEDLTNRIVNKLLHEPTLRLKEVASSSDAGRYAEVVRHLFSLQGVNNGTN
ncbi:MAG TPA: glutamyl-tRNA reductase [Chloroflexia bacterium]|nr:glutamyl-tRNA reductase [Chloroflexia bacterium]